MGFFFGMVFCLMIVDVGGFEGTGSFLMGIVD
jgi:hypothetical protein